MPVHTVICLRTWSRLTFPFWMLKRGLVPTPPLLTSSRRKCMGCLGPLLRRAPHHPGGLQPPLGDQEREAHVDTCAHPAAAGLKMLFRNTRGTLRGISTRQRVKDRTLRSLQPLCDKADIIRSQDTHDKDVHLQALGLSSLSGTSSGRSLEATSTQVASPFLTRKRFSKQYDHARDHHRRTCSHDRPRTEQALARFTSSTCIYCVDVEIERCARHNALAQIALTRTCTWEKEEAIDLLLWTQSEKDAALAQCAQTKKDVGCEESYAGPSCSGRH